MIYTRTNGELLLLRKTEGRNKANTYIARTEGSPGATMEQIFPAARPGPSRPRPDGTVSADDYIRVHYLYDDNMLFRLLYRSHTIFLLSRRLLYYIIRCDAVAWQRFSRGGTTYAVGVRYASVFLLF